MKIGLFSDIHGNLPALESCLAELHRARVERLIFLGDAIGYLPDAAAVVAMLSAAHVECLLGNHEAMFLSPSDQVSARDDVYRLSQARLRLSAAAKATIAGWPRRLDEMWADSSATLVHGSPAEPLTGYLYPDSANAELFPSTGPAVLFCGHTHRPFVRRAGHRLVVNVGSVGLPRDEVGFGAFALYDTTTGQAEIRRFRLDLDRLAGLYGGDVHPSVLARLLGVTQPQV